jgi:hypothetical protein
MARTTHGVLPQDPTPHFGNTGSTRQLPASKIADTGVENVNAQVDDLIHHGRAAPGVGLHGTELLELDARSVVALRETSLALPAPLYSVSMVRRLVEFYVHEHKRVLPHSGFATDA